MKAKINENKCTGCGICTNICPEGVEISGRKAKIKNENAECLKEAASACPMGAIEMESLSGKNEAMPDDKAGADFPNGYDRGMGRGRGCGQGGGRGTGRGGGYGRGQGMGRGGGMGTGGGRNRREE